MILLNLSGVPGHGTDRIPPTAPAKASKKIETYGGHTGVAVRWSPSQDNVLVAEYRVWRDGEFLDHVAIGAFYFDAGAGSSLTRRYEIVAVDGDGNRSAAVVAGQ
jgi:hypothetical protein